MGTIASVHEKFEDWPSVKSGPDENFPLYGKRCTMVIIMVHTRHTEIMIGHRKHFLFMGS